MVGSNRRPRRTRRYLFAATATLLASLLSVYIFTSQRKLDEKRMELTFQAVFPCFYQKHSRLPATRVDIRETLIANEWSVPDHLEESKVSWTVQQLSPDEYSVTLKFGWWNGGFRQFVLERFEMEVAFCK